MASEETTSPSKTDGCSLPERPSALPPHKLDSSEYAALLSEYERLAYAQIVREKDGVNGLDIKATVQLLAELRAQLYAISISTSSSHVAGPPFPLSAQAVNAALCGANRQIISLNLRNPIVGTGWHHAEQEGRWTGPARVSSLVLPPLPQGAYAVEFTTIGEASPGLADGLRLYVNDLECALACQKQQYKRVFSGSFILAEECAAPFLTLDLIAPKTVRPSELRDSRDSRLLGIKVSHISIFPEAASEPAP